MSKKKYKGDTKIIIKRLWKASVHKYKYHYILAFFFMVLCAAGEALTIKMFQPIIDRVFVAQEVNMLWPIGFSVLFIFFVKGLALYGQSGLMGYIGLNVVADMQKKLFSHISTLDNNFYHNNKTGSLVTRFTVDTVMMRNAVSDTLTSLGKDTLTVIFLVILMFYQDATLACIVLFIFPAAFYPVIYLGRKMRKVTAHTQSEMGSLTSVLEQIFHSISIIKSYNMEDYEKGKVGYSVDKIFKHSYKAVKNRAISRPLMELFGGVAIVVVIVYGGSTVIEGKTTPGAFLAFLGALITAYRPMKSVAKLNVNLQEGLAGAERLFEIMDIEPEIKDKENAITLNEKAANIEIKNLDFKYPGNKDVSLKDINLFVKKGKTIALVGSSGAGKTTLLNLIPRFYDCDKGEILVNGKNIKDLTLKSLREHVSLVSQDVAIFDASIKDNIKYGSLDATDKEIEKAAKLAAADTFIKDLDYGYETIVGERGAKLSGGQRQRISIARAILKNAPILLLDEATSALDTESERQVQKALEHLMKGRTTIAIAHRLSTIINSDCIYVLDKGKLVEQGNNEELLKKNGVYAKFYNLQFGNKE